jgi:hypothetical protein
MLATLTQTLLAAGIGAFLANLIAEVIKGQVRRSQSMEAARDEDLATLLRMLDELQDLATTYWLSDVAGLGAQEPVMRARMLSRQQHLLDLIAHLFTGAPKRDCDVLATRLMDAVGGGSFGEPDRLAEPQRLASIYGHGLALAHLAKRCRRDLRRGLLA